MAEVFGDFIEDLPEHAEYLIIGFSPTSVPLKQRWRNNGLSADFIADYMHTFFVSEDDQICRKVHARKNAVKYIANELLENAMKFSSQDAIFPTRIAFHLLANKLIFNVVNSIPSETVDHFQKLLRRLESEDPNELYIRQMELNASEENNSYSGLGFLSMICDYSAKLGWKFETLPNTDPPVITVTTMATLSV